jgi:hypothetical protein
VSAEFVSLVDAFVERVNSEPRQLESVAEVPAFLREEVPESLRHTVPEDSTGWRVVRCDYSARIDELQIRTARRFPPSFYYFLSNYSFPAFQFGALMFFANTGEDTYWELAKRLVSDPHMSPNLLRAGFLQIGNPFFYNYDPVCFDSNSAKGESRIVQLDHEAILLHGEMAIVKEVAPSFVELLQRARR